MATPAEQTQKQLLRFLTKVAQKFPADSEALAATDIHLRLAQDSGELTARDDDGAEITRCVVEPWIGSRSDSFYDDAARQLREAIGLMRDTMDSLGIAKPFNFTLENDDEETVCELYMSDDELAILGGDLMGGLDADLDKFMDGLLKE